MANQNAQNEKEISKYENIKQLNSALQSGVDYFGIITRVRDMRRNIDSLLSGQRRKLAATRQAVTEKAKVNSATVAQPVKQVEAKPVSNQSVKETVTPKPAPKAPIKPSNEPVASQQSIETVQPQANKTTTYVPSYVKGMITPPPKPQPRQRTEKRNNQFGTRPNANNGPRSGNGQRPNGPRTDSRQPYAGQRPQIGARPIGAAMPRLELPGAGKDRKQYDKKKDFNRKNDESSVGMNKRTLIRKGFIQEDINEDRIGTRKLKSKKPKQPTVFTPVKIEKAVITTDNLTPKILSEKIGKTVQEIIKQLMMLGYMASMNSVVDYETMELVADALGVKLERKVEQTQEEQLEAAFNDVEDDEASLSKRPPIITVMGHVDHGKTSLLDAIRKTSVALGEAGGITQHIGAYSVTCNGEKITFLDTPGHEAFTEMRARGAQVTDIAVLVVAADDGIMPQTIEAIKHAKNANVPIIVAVNKIDKPTANIERIKEQLSEYELVPEEWGGDTIIVPISAKQGIGIDKLLEMILLVADVNNYRANPSRQAKGSVIEARIDRTKGAIANIIIQNGTLHTGDFLVAGMTCGRVKAMTDDTGRRIKEAGPSTPVSILGFTEVPFAGDSVFAVSDEKIAKKLIDERTAKMRNEQTNQSHTLTLGDMFNKMNETKLKEFDLVIKADVQGSVEALVNALSKISNEEVKVKVIASGVGAINKTDIMHAEVNNSAMIIGFNVHPDSEAKSMAEKGGINVRMFNVIYDAIDAVTETINGMLTPKFNEVILGRAQVRNVIKISGVGLIAGSYVTKGKIMRNSKVRVWRSEEMIFEGEISNLKRFKDDVKEVAEGFECGISVKGFNDFIENDEIEAYVLEAVK